METFVTILVLSFVAFIVYAFVIFLFKKSSRGKDSKEKTNNSEEDFETFSFYLDEYNRKIEDLNVDKSDYLVNKEIMDLDAMKKKNEYTSTPYEPTKLSNIQAIIVWIIIFIIFYILYQFKES